MCDTPLEVKYMLAETENRARALVNCARNRNPASHGLRFAITAVLARMGVPGLSAGTKTREFRLGVEA